MWLNAWAANVQCVHADAVDDLVLMARQAVVTPSLDAAAALNVLADEMLNRGIIAVVLQPVVTFKADGVECLDVVSVDFEYGQVDTTQVAGESWSPRLSLPPIPRPTPLEYAFAWARFKTVAGVAGEIRLYSDIEIIVNGHTYSRDNGRTFSSDWVSARVVSERDAEDKSHRTRRGINGAPLALRAKLKPWER